MVPASTALYDDDDLWRAPVAPGTCLPVQRCLTCAQSTSGTITIVATPAIDNAMMVVQMRALLVHDDDGDDGDDDDGIC